MNNAKIQLSPAEQKLVQNAEVLLTKNRVLAKMTALLQQVQDEMMLRAPTFSNAHIFEIPPKISRGENYLGLPYLVLDFPRVFQQEGVFAIRSFFWWGKFFSSTLQLSGHYKELYFPKLDAATFSNYHIGVNADPWQHHFETDNYQPVAELAPAVFNEIVQAQPHVKLAAKLPVEQWESAETFFLEHWMAYLTALR